ncbi:MAG: hypothetical protein ACI83O_000801 [Patescibacteria group bacterium]|jgi:hypothetical protein
MVTRKEQEMADLKSLGVLENDLGKYTLTERMQAATRIFQQAKIVRSFYKRTKDMLIISSPAQKLDEIAQLFLRPDSTDEMLTIDRRYYKEIHEAYNQLTADVERRIEQGFRNPTIQGIYGSAKRMINSSPYAFIPRSCKDIAQFHEVEDDHKKYTASSN